MKSLPIEFWASSAIATLGMVLVVLGLTERVDQDWVLGLGVALFVVFTPAEVYFLSRSQRERG